MPDPPRKRVYVTGLGCVTPLGSGAEQFRQGLLEGKAGVQSVPHLENNGLNVTYAGYSAEFEPEQWIAENRDQKNTSRSVPMLFAAAREALEDAGLTDVPDPRRVGVVLGSGGGSSDFTEEQYRWYFTGNGRPSVYNISSSTPGNLSSELSMKLNVHGPSHLISTGCTSSSDAFGHALMQLRSGHAGAVICGGVDTPVMPGIMKGFETMRVLAGGHEDRPEAACRPFDASRNGMVLGEGCWLTVLETEDHLEQRGGPEPAARLVSYSSGCSAHHRVRLEEDGTNGVRTVETALERAGWAPDTVDFFHLHGTGTKLNDRVEASIFREVFSDPPPAASIKGSIGHPQGASGAAGLTAAIGSLTSNTIPPVRNHRDPDPDWCSEFIPTAPLHTDVRRAVVNCLGFGSRCSVLTLTDG